MRNTKTTDMQAHWLVADCSAGSHPVIAGVKGHLGWIARRAVSNTSRQINT